MDQNSVNSGCTAILLAAGYGSRINALTDGPKCLLEINGKTLLAHHFESWQRAGIQKAHLVLGYKADEVKEQALKSAGGLELSFSTNEDYRNKGNTYSLGCALKEVRGSALIFDADLVYEHSILANFLADPIENQILTGLGELDDIECAKVLTDKNKRVFKTVDKRALSAPELKEYQFDGEALGILKFNPQTLKELRQACEKFLEKPSQILLNWEHLLNQFLPQHPVYSHKTTNPQWVEIDTPEDYQQARELFSKGEKLP